GDFADVALATVKSLGKLGFLFGGQADTIILHRNQQFSVLDEGRDLDGRWRKREFCGVGDDLAQRLLDQDGVDVHEREIAAEAQRYAAIGKTAPHAFDRRV